MTAALPQLPAWLVPSLVVHKRLRPHAHELRYRVFSLLLDIDRIDEAAAQCRWFSRNRANLLAFYDRDHGAAVDRPISQEARQIFQGAGLACDDARILLLAYPRVFGMAFNPLSVYFLVGTDGVLRGLIYEVNNTFGERKSYVLPAGAPTAETYAQNCDKELYVSPFTPPAGRYSFRVRLADGATMVGVALRDVSGPLLKTHTAGRLEPLTSSSALSAALQTPLQMAKIIGGIHWEALKLWLKGVPLVRRHRSPAYSISPAPQVGLALKDEHV
jgi:uncharacterized protein